MSPVELVRGALVLSRQRLTAAGPAGRIRLPDAPTPDISTRADLDIAVALRDYLTAAAPSARLLSEETGTSGGGGSPDLTIAIDELDGTGNWHRGGSLLPFCTAVAVLRGGAPRFSDVLAAGVVEHRSGRTWIAERGAGSWADGARVRASEKERADREALVILDHYGSGAGVGDLTPIHPRTWVKDFGSSAFHFAGVAEGMFDAFVTTGQKGHELAAGWLLVTEAGGTVTDFAGSALGDREFLFSARYRIVASGTQGLGQELRRLITI